VSVASRAWSHLAEGQGKRNGQGYGINHSHYHYQPRGCISKSLTSTP